jgi:sterol desaturase/sphingolipid hydroxylase (fatty acid hydroxylase superfamily)
MDVEIILIALSPIFIMCILYEFLKHRQHYVVKDSLANTALALMHQGADAIALFFLMPFFYWLYTFRLFDIELGLLSLFGAFLLQDFLYYWFHRASHHIHWLWAAHVVHHSSTEMNFSTAFRQSIMYPIAGMWLFWMPMILVGFDPKIVFTIVALNLAFQFFVHTKIIGKLGVLENVFNTPSTHRVHHAVNPGYLDKNFAGVLVIWDKIFGTYVEEQDDKPCRYGIVGQIDTFNPIKISFHQWLYMFKTLVKTKGLKSKMGVLFSYPTSSVSSSSKNNRASSDDNDSPLYD